MCSQVRFNASILRPEFQLKFTPVKVSCYGTYTIHITQHACTVSQPYYGQVLTTLPPRPVPFSGCSVRSGSVAHLNDHTSCHTLSICLLDACMSSHTVQWNLSTTHTGTCLSFVEGWTQVRDSLCTVLCSGDSRQSSF